MRAHGSRLGRLVGLLLSAAAASGCQHLASQPEYDASLPALKCQDIPPACRDHVYVFLIHGTDPLDFANLHGLNSYLRDLGFRKTYLGQLYHRDSFTKEVRRLHSADPEARFVLIGFSLGANMVRDIANAVKEDGIHIDTLVYLGGNTLEDGPRDRPDNCGQVINILARGAVWNGTDFADGDNIHLPDVYHFGSPMHPYTRQRLAAELLAGGLAPPELMAHLARPRAPHGRRPRPVAPYASRTSIAA